MARNDWLIGGDRRGEAAERIYAAATDLVSRNGFENFSIDALAAAVHCAPATIYRNAGGKKAILEAVTMRMSARIVEAVRTAIENLQGADRVATAIAVALARIRAEPLGPLIMGSVQPDHDGEIAHRFSRGRRYGRGDHRTGRPTRGAVAHPRRHLGLWFWPLKDRVAEYELVQRFVGRSTFRTRRRPDDGSPSTPNLVRHFRTMRGFHRNSHPLLLVTHWWSEHMDTQRSWVVGQSPQDGSSVDHIEGSRSDRTRSAREKDTVTLIESAWRSSV